jgi:hypothetical protein
MFTKNQNLYLIIYIMFVSQALRNLPRQKTASVTFRKNINNGCFFKFGVEVGVEPSIVNALYRLRITDQLFKSYAFTRVVRSQSTLQRLLRRQI